MSVSERRECGRAIVVRALMSGATGQSSSSLRAQSPEEALVLTWVHTAVEESHGKMLCLPTVTANCEPPHAGVSVRDFRRLRSLWGMSKERRMELWRELQPKLHLEEVVLHGGSLEDECPMEDEEFAVLFPSGSLSSLRSLHLCNVAKLTDRGFATLAQAGCGKSLTSLRVDGRCKGITGEGLMFLVEAGCGTSLTSLSLHGICLAA